MRLRNRGIGIGETFYPFKRLPIEIRQLIWRFTLKARVVEVLWATLEGEKATLPELRFMLGLEGPLPSADEIVFMSLSKIPTALQVSKDSRNAVLPFYPLCFSASTHGPRIRFNLSLDTLYVDNMITQYGLDLFKNFNATELSKLEKLAVMEMYGHDGQGFAVWDANWAALGIEINRLVGIKELFHVVNASMVFLYTPTIPGGPDPLERTLYKKFGCIRYRERGVEFYEEYPKEVARLINYPEDKLGLYTEHKVQWAKKPKLIWGWRSFAYADQ